MSPFFSSTYLQISLGNEKNKDVNLPSPLHPMMTRALDILEPVFIEKVLPASGHGILATPEKCQDLLDTLPKAAAQVREKLLSIWSKEGNRSTPAEKWAQLKTHLISFCKVQSKKSGTNKAAKMDRSQLETWPAATVFNYTYPRLDINVSKMRNHLLKSPFCVHPKTGCVCVPIRVAAVDEFDPAQVPTLARLVQELDDYEDGAENNDDDMENDNSSHTEHWKKTSLQAYFEPFQKEFLDPMLRKQRRRERDEAEQQAALAGDF